MTLCQISEGYREQNNTQSQETLQNRGYFDLLVLLKTVCLFFFVSIVYARSLQQTQFVRNLTSIPPQTLLAHNATALWDSGSTKGEKEIPTINKSEDKKK